MSNFLPQLLHAAVEHGHVLHHRTRHLQLLGTKRRAPVKALAAIGFRQLVEQGAGREALLIGPAGLIHLYCERHGAVRVDTLLIDRSVYPAIDEALSQVVSFHPVSRGEVYVIAQSGPEFYFRQAGLSGVDLEKTNYTTEVIAGFDHVVEDLATSTPCGRMTLVTGPPGTGKTHLVRALIGMASNATFIVVPPETVRQLLQPHFVPALLEFATRKPRPGPMVLLLEDADECLVPRQTDNMRSIVALLNASDGIIGALLDLRIVATSNAKHIEIDPAVLRPGRLCRRIEVPLLTPTHAHTVLGRLMKRDAQGAFKRDVSLAEVYRTARESGWQLGVPNTLLQ